MFDNNTFVDDSQYSNFLFAPPVLVAGALIKNKKDKKRKDAEHKVKLGELEKIQADNRIEFAKTFEERKKAEQDKLKAEQKIDEGKKEIAQTNDDANKLSSGGGGSKKKYYIIGGGVLVVVIGIAIYLKMRNK